MESGGEGFETGGAREWYYRKEGGIGVGAKCDGGGFCRGGGWGVVGYTENSI